MEKTQFVFKREVVIPPVKEDLENGTLGTDGYTNIVLDSFDVERVVRSITMDDGGLLVLLDDLHERFETQPQTHPKTGAPKFDKKGQMMFERLKNTFQSEIQLNSEDAKDFYKLVAINKYE
jgi:hypothetical protein